MRKLSANYIIPATGKVLKNGILILDDKGRVLELIDTGGELKEESSLEFYNGVLVPGFINTHCHLELSHIKGKTAKAKGLTHFISEMAHRAPATEKEIQKAIKQADEEMQGKGIVAVGDICNTAFSFEQKQNSPIRYHSFIEVYGSDPARAKEKMSTAKELASLIKNNYPHAHSLVPHAPYTVPPELFELLQEEFSKSIVSIHNQESAEEQEMFEDGSGELFEFLREVNKKDLIPPKTKNSLEYSLKYIQSAAHILLVHNTYTTKKDLELAKDYQKQSSLVLCPNANLYIEDRLPDIELLQNSDLNIAIGTDSLASNDSLSILDEINTISKYFPAVELEELIRWATINGAMALGMDNELGSFEAGKTPGVNLLSTLDLQNLKLTGNTSIRKLV